MVYGLVVDSKPEVYNTELYYLYTKLNPDRFTDMYILYKIDKSAFLIEEITYLKLQGLTITNWVY